MLLLFTAFVIFAPYVFAEPDAFGIYLNECVLVLSGTPNWETILVASVLILLGLYVGVSGGSGSYLALYANGFLSVSTICTIITWNAEPFDGYSQRTAVYLSVWMMTGFGGGVYHVDQTRKLSKQPTNNEKPGLLFGFSPYYGHLLANSFYGLCFGLEFLSLNSGGLFSAVLARGLFLVPFIATPLVLSYFHPKHVMSVMSGLAGGFILLLGLDLFLQQGFIAGIAAFMTFSIVGANAAAMYVFDLPKQIMISASLLLGLVAALFQYRYAIRTFGSAADGGSKA
ncbi:UNVERIFIED_CONTAM: hypothetical protein HDU68_000143 [Siphonaria sp. JEL0065]|nr:hypothetical protein HDU68_000143 [Siphonaria sp. JEL0065]